MFMMVRKQYVSNSSPLFAILVSIVQKKNTFWERFFGGYGHRGFGGTRVFRPFLGVTHEQTPPTKYLCP